MITENKSRACFKDLPAVWAGELLPHHSKLDRVDVRGIHGPWSGQSPRAAPAPAAHAPTERDVWCRLSVPAGEWACGSCGGRRQADYLRTRMPCFLQFRWDFSKGISWTSLEYGHKTAFHFHDFGNANRLQCEQLGIEYKNAPIFCLALQIFS